MTIQWKRTDPAYPFTLKVVNAKISRNAN